MTPQHREIVPEPQGQAIITGLALRAEAQLHVVELAVAEALRVGVSINEVGALSGLSTTTVQKYGRVHGWPTASQVAAREAKAESRDEWDAKMAAAEAVIAQMSQVKAGTAETE